MADRIEPNVCGRRGDARAVVVRRLWMVGSLLLLLVLGAAGCTDLKEVRAFADVSAESVKYKELVDDYTGSPQRQKRYEPGDHQAELVAIRDKRKLQEERLLALQKGVADYMDALGKLAADDLTSYDKELDGMVKSAKDNNLLNDKDANALGQIGKVLAKAATDGWRKAQLRQIIGDANEPLQTVLAALNAVATKEFVSGLDNETTAINKYYNGEIAGAMHQTPPAPGAAALLREYQYDHLDAVAAKRQAAIEYGKVLDKIAKGHKDLFDHRDKLSSATLLASMAGYTRDLGTLYNAMHAFGK